MICPVSVIRAGKDLYAVGREAGRYPPEAREAAGRENERDTLGRPAQDSF